MQEQATRPQKELNILVFTNDTSSPYWRFNGQARHFNQETTVSMYVTSNKSWNGRTMGADIVILEMLTNPAMVQMCKDQGAIVVFECDDASIDTYEEKGRKHLMHVNDKWKEQSIKTIQACDAVTVTNHYLKENIARFYKGPIFILPNYVDFGWYGKETKISPPRATDEVRIGWFGSKGHYEDLVMVTNAIKRVLEKYPQAKFIYTGSGGMSSDKASTQVGWGEDFFKEIPRGRREFYKGVDAELWPMKHRLCDLDIGLAPLIDDNFNHCKTGIKWMEYAVTGVPAVVSPVVYAEHPEEKEGSMVTDGVNALVAQNEEEWFEKICLLVEDAELRKTMAAAALKEVQEKWNLDDHLARFEKVYREIDSLR